MATCTHSNSDRQQISGMAACTHTNSDSRSQGWQLALTPTQTADLRDGSLHSHQLRQQISGMAACTHTNSDSRSQGWQLALTPTQIDSRSQGWQLAPTPAQSDSKSQDGVFLIVVLLEAVCFEASLMPCCIYWHRAELMDLKVTTLHCGCSSSPQYGCRISEQQTCDLVPPSAPPTAFNPGRNLTEGKAVAASFFSCDQAALRTLQSVFLSVRPSICHTFFTMFPSSYHLFYPRPVLAFGYCRCLRPSVRHQQGWGKYQIYKYEYKYEYL